MFEVKSVVELSERLKKRSLTQDYRLPHKHLTCRLQSASRFVKAVELRGSVPETEWNGGAYESCMVRKPAFSGLGQNFNIGWKMNRSFLGFCFIHHASNRNTSQEKRLLFIALSRRRVLNLLEYIFHMFEAFVTTHNGHLAIGSWNILLRHHRAFEDTHAHYLMPLVAG